MNCLQRNNEIILHVGANSLKYELKKVSPFSFEYFIVGKKITRRLKDPWENNNSFSFFF